MPSQTSISFYLSRVGERQREKLRLAGIPFELFSLKAGTQPDGILVESRNVDAALRTLGHARNAETATDYQGIMEISHRPLRQRRREQRNVGFTFRNRRSRLAVVWHNSFQADGHDDFMSIVTEKARRHLLPILNRNVVIGHSRSDAPPDDGAFHILLRSIPPGVETTRVNLSNRVWELEAPYGSRLHRIDRGKLSDEQRIVSPEGDMVACLIDHVLYLPIGFGSYNAYAAEIVGKIIAAAVGKLKKQRHPRTPQFMALVHSWNGASEEAFISIARDTLVPVMKRNVVFDVPHGKSQKTEEDGNFHVYLWSSPMGNIRATPPNVLWGNGVDCRDKAFLPTGTGIPIVDDRGWAVGELFNDALYVHHDLCDVGTKKEAAIFQQLCKEVAAIIRRVGRSAAPRRVSDVTTYGLGVPAASQKSYVNAVRETLLPAIPDRKVIIVPAVFQTEQNPIAATIAPHANFTVQICSPGAEEKAYAVPESLWGHQTSLNGGTPLGHSPVKMFGEIITDDAGFPVAQLSGDALTILIALTDGQNKEHLKIFHKILGVCTLLLTGTKAEVIQYRTQRDAKLLEAASSNFSAFVAKNLIDVYASKSRQLANIRAEIQILKTRLRDRVRAGHLLEVDLAKGSWRDEEGLREKITRELSSIRKTRGVQDVVVVDSAIIMYTDTIYCQNPKTGLLRELGKYRIELRPFAENKEEMVLWFNLTRQVDGNEEIMQHPHVYSDGHACLGNADEMIPPLMANLEFGAVATVAIRFLESVNMADIGEDIEHWPLAPASMQPKNPTRRDDE